MSRRIWAALGILLLMGIASAASVFAYILLVGGSGKASQPISAPTLDRSTPTPDAAQTRIAQLSTQVSELKATNAALSAVSAVSTASSTVAATLDPTSLSTAAATRSAAVATQPSVPSTTGAKLYRIVQDGSTVTFTLTEDLMDEANTVVGSTNQVAGEILVDFATPANSKVGVIRINARTLETDIEFRNKALRAQILESSKPEYEFIEFTPKKIQGLPEKIDPGKPVTFKITGDLKIREIVQSVTFDVTAQAADNKLEGSAKAQVTRDQFNLQIPSVAGVANVSNDVTLEIKFVATPAA